MHQLHAAIAIRAEPERIRSLLNDGWKPQLRWLQVTEWDANIQPAESITAVQDPRSARWEIAAPLDAPHGSRLELHVTVRAPLAFLEPFVEPFATDWVMAELWRLKQEAEHPPVE
jgi:hypothetical protein